MTRSPSGLLIMPALFVTFPRPLPRILQSPGWDYIAAAPQYYEGHVRFKPGSSSTSR